MPWDEAEGKLVRVVTKADFADALAYVNRVGEVAEARNHHPDIEISWNTVTLRLWSHNAGKVTDADRDLAAAIDALEGDRGEGESEALVPIAPGAAAPVLPDDVVLPVVLAFFKKSCPVCQMAFPVYGRLAQDANVVAVAQDHAADGWLAERGFASTVIDDSDGYPLSNACGIRTVPTLVLVEGDGKIGAVAEGWDRDAVNDMAARLGGVGPVSTPADGLPPFKPG